MQDLEGLAKFVIEKMESLNLNVYDVAQRATSKGHKIVHGTVWNVINQNSKEVKDRTIIAIAKGLGVPEDQLFDIVRKKVISNPTDKPQSVAEFVDRLAAMGFNFGGFDVEDMSALTPDDLQDLIDDIEAKILFKTRKK